MFVFDSPLAGENDVKVYGLIVGLKGAFRAFRSQSICLSLYSHICIYIYINLLLHIYIYICRMSICVSVSLSLSLYIYICVKFLKVLF